MKKFREGGSYALCPDRFLRRRRPKIHARQACRSKQTLTNQEFMPSEYYTTYIPYISAIPKEDFIPVGNTNRQQLGWRKLLPTSLIVLCIAETMKNKVALCLTGLLSVSISSFFLMALKNIRILCLGFLCFMLFNLSTAQAQSAEPRTAEGQTEIRPLQIGDTIPEELWNLPLQVINHPEGKDTITLNDYRDKKLIILDFWATWCGPCITSLRKLDSIEAEFEADVLILPSSTEEVGLVKDKFGKEGFSLMTAAEQIMLRKYFPCQYLPHQVWISNNQLYITTDGEGNPRESIQRFINGETPNLKRKDDIFFEPFTFIDKYAVERNSPVISKSIVTKYIDGMGNSGLRKNDSLQTYYFLNRPVLEILRTVSKVDYNRMILTDSSEIERLVNSEFDKTNLYCYQLFADASQNENTLKRKMISDLRSAFKLSLNCSPKAMPCYVVAPVKRHKQSYREDQVYPITSLIAMLNYAVEWQEDLPIFLDETKGTYFLSEKPSNTTINSWRTEPEKLHEVLLEIGLTISKEIRDIDMLIIKSDANNE